MKWISVRLKYEVQRPIVIHDDSSNKVVNILIIRKVWSIIKKFYSLAWFSPLYNLYIHSKHDIICYLYSFVHLRSNINIQVEIISTHIFEDEKPQ